jgi:hypothetical protein
MVYGVLVWARRAESTCCHQQRSEICLVYMLSNDKTKTKYSL